MLKVGLSNMQGGDAMPTLTIDKPSPKQELFLTDKHRHVAFGGA